MADNDSPSPREEPRSSDSDDDEIRLSEIRELISDDGSKNVLHRIAQFGSISRRLMEAGNNDVYHRRIDMNQKSLAVAVLIATLAVGLRADAGMVNFGFSGAGVSGSGILTFGADTVANDPIGAYAISGISGSFTDAALNIKNEAITGIVAIAPGPYQGTPFPASLTVLTTTGLESSISYDNLFYPGGSPVTCATYPGAGGFLDIYGVLFTLANGVSVDLWSNGTFPHGPPLSYGVGVIDPNMKVIDYQAGGVQAYATPEPGSLCLLATGLLGALACRMRFAGSRS